jgi:1-acyl-sn-glycerol-3-phosphate acyltransferase
VRTSLTVVLNRLWGLCYSLVWLALGLATALAVLPTPGLNRRRALARAGARALFQLPGLSLEVQGLSSLPTSPCVVVANHASYLDGAVLTAALPPRFAFVIKQEAARVPLVGWVLRRIGSEFVDRFDRNQVHRDARRVVRLAGAGQSLVVFPEGTFVDRAGLGRFHAGAFVAATRAGLPVVPAVIQGTRSVLSPSSALPRPGAIRVTVLPAIYPDGAGRHATHRLLTAVRGEMLAQLGEPDLAPSGRELPG